MTSPDVGSASVLWTAPDARIITLRRSDTPQPPLDSIDENVEYPLEIIESRERQSSSFKLILSLLLCQLSADQRIVIVVSLLSWYCSSMGITALNKYLFDTLDFNYPLLVTFIHFSSVSIFLHLIFFLCPRCSGDISVSSLLSNISWRHIIPISVLGAVEIALSNLAYPEVSISVMTVIKSSLVVVTYLLSVCMGLEQFSGKLFGIVVFIFSSICLTVPGMDVKRVIGVWFLVGAVLAAGVRWVLVHEQLQIRQYAPMQLMFLTQPFCALSLAGPASVRDVTRLLEHVRESGSMPPYLIQAMLLTSAAVVLAFLVVFAEYHLVRVTSSVSLTVAGVGKEAATILMSMVLFHERVDPKAAIGIVASIVGIISYSRLRYTSSVNLPSYTVSEDDERSIKDVRVTVPVTSKAACVPARDCVYIYDERCIDRLASSATHPSWLANKDTGNAAYGIPLADMGPTKQLYDMDEDCHVVVDSSDITDATMFSDGHPHRIVSSGVLC